MLCRDFDRRVEVDLPRLPARRDGPMIRSWNWKPVFAKPTNVKLDGACDPAQGAVDRLTGRNAPRKIRNGRPPIAAWITVDPHEILKCFHDFDPLNPACRFTEANVPFGMSSPRLPLTVTRPVFVGCLN